MKKTILALFAVFCILFLSTCFSPWEGNNGESSLTINLGGSARAFYTVAEPSSFTHEITLRNANGTTVVQEVFSGASVTISVQPGTYTLSIKGFGADNALRSYGIKSGIQVKAGQNNVPLEMYSAVEVDSPTSLSDAFTAAGQNSSRKYYVLVKGDIYITSQVPTLTNGKVTLIAEAAGKITKTFNAGGAMLSVNGGDLTLGVPGMAGTITLDSSASPSGAANLITVISGTLVMYDGVTISKNNTISGDGVSVTGGTFTMWGGEISGNTVTGVYNGGGVNISGGTFNMHGGEISNNTVGGNGGGVSVSGASATFTMYGGKISDNTSSGSGGGVSVSGANAKFEMHGGEISGNKANMSGGGVYVDNTGTFRIVTGTIYGSNEAESLRNTAPASPNSGAALFHSNATATYGPTGTEKYLAGTVETTIRVVNGIKQ
jgi:hypothetical protein